VYVRLSFPRVLACVYMVERCIHNDSNNVRSCSLLFCSDIQLRSSSPPLDLSRDKKTITAIACFVEACNCPRLVCIIVV